MIQVQLLPGTIGKCEVPSLHQLDTHMVLHVIHHLFTSKQYVQCVFEVVGIVSYWHSVVSFEFFDLELRCRDLVVEALANSSVVRKNVPQSARESMAFRNDSRFFR